MSSPERYVNSKSNSPSHSASLVTKRNPCQDCAHWIQKIVDRRSNGVYTDSHGRTVTFDLLLEDNLEEGHQGLNLEQLIDEALIFITAGTDTTSFGLSAATFYILHTPSVLQKLQEELQSVPRGQGGRFERRTGAEFAVYGMFLLLNSSA